MESGLRRFILVAVLAASAFSVAALGEDFKVTEPRASIKIPKSLPSCPRPQDFSIAKDVSTYEHCVEIQDKFCDIHDTSSECKKLMESHTRKVIRPGGDVDAANICAIQHDGSYKCDSETLRFTIKDDVARPGGSPGPSEIQPLNEDGSQGPPPGPVGAAPGTPGAPGAPGTEGANPGNPTGGPNGNPMPFMPPPPPGYVPPNH